MPTTAFIVSSGRTGTKFLAGFFRASLPGVLALHEPAPTHHLRILGNAHVAGHLSRSRMAAVLRLSRASLLRRRGGRDYIESNPFLFGFSGVLGAVFDNPRIFHLVRDPREFVRSSLNYGTWSGYKRAAARLVPFWFPQVRARLGIHAHLSPVGIFAGHWRLVNEFVSANAGAQAGYLRLRYEEVFDQDNSGLRRMCAELGYDYPESGAARSTGERVNTGSLTVIGDWRTWSPAQCRELDSVCGLAMREFGYGLEPEWQQLVNAPP